MSDKIRFDFDLNNLNCNDSFRLNCFSKDMKVTTESTKSTIYFRDDEVPSIGRCFFGKNFFEKGYVILDNRKSKNREQMISVNQPSFPSKKATPHQLTLKGVRIKWIVK
jgi:hypothetical protein